MKKKMYKIYGANVEVISMSTASVTYRVIETGIICRLGMKNWRANAEEVA